MGPDGPTSVGIRRTEIRGGWGGSVQGGSIENRTKGVKDGIECINENY